MKSFLKNWNTILLQLTYSILLVSYVQHSDQYFYRLHTIKSCNIIVSEVNFPSGSTSLVAQTVKHLSTMRETWVWSLGREVPWRRKRQPTPVLLPRKSHGRRRLVSMGSQRIRYDWATSLSLSETDRSFGSCMWKIFLFIDLIREVVDLILRMFLLWTLN